MKIYKTLKKFFDDKLGIRKSDLKKKKYKKIKIKLERRKKELKILYKSTKNKVEMEEKLYEYKNEIVIIDRLLKKVKKKLKNSSTD